VQSLGIRPSAQGEDTLELRLHRMVPGSRTRTSRDEEAVELDRLPIGQADPVEGAMPFTMASPSPSPRGGCTAGVCSGPTMSSGNGASSSSGAGPGSRFPLHRWEARPGLADPLNANQMTPPGLARPPPPPRRGRLRFAPERGHPETGHPFDLGDVSDEER
jgi:hypothetical protein